jgi:hypothetical protein
MDGKRDCGASPVVPSLSRDNRKNAKKLGREQTRTSFWVENTTLFFSSSLLWFFFLFLGGEEGHEAQNDSAARK